MEVPKRRRELEDMLEEWAEVGIERASGCDLEIVYVVTRLGGNTTLCRKFTMLTCSDVPKIYFIQIIVIILCSTRLKM